MTGHKELIFLTNILLDISVRAFSPGGDWHSDQ